jgi:hypothetical protein
MALINIIIVRNDFFPKRFYRPLSQIISFLMRLFLRQLDFLEERYFIGRDPHCRKAGIALNSKVFLK